ncbi:MAG: hypothetical protein QM715_05410 [Nibricoccus sp.]
MKKLQTIISIGVLTASMLCSILARAQTTATSETSQGNLGKRYGSLDFAIGDPSHTSDNIYGTSLGVNIPVTRYLDISGGYGYSRYKTEFPGFYAYKSEGHGLSADLVFYKALSNGLKPFISAGLGYSWTTTKIESRSMWTSNGKFKDDSGSWSTSVGIEIPFRWIALTPSIGFGGDFEGQDSQAWTYGLEASSWITRKVGIFAGVAYAEPRKNYSVDVHMWSYGAGLRFKF